MYVNILDMYVCMYVCMHVCIVRMPLKSTRRLSFFFSPKTLIFRTPVSSDTTALRKSNFKLKTPNCEIIPAEQLFIKSQKVTVTGYYGIENPLYIYI